MKTPLSLCGYPAPGRRLKMLRERCGWSIRKLAEMSGVTATMISFIERDKTSPSMALLHKLLVALDTDLPSFFGGEPRRQSGPMFPRETMQLINDAERSYTIVFPRREGVDVEMLDEQIHPAKKRPPFETLKCDVAGYVIAGALVIEIKGEKTRSLRPGDAFYAPRGRPHRGYAVGEPARLITVYAPPRY